jgi:hypothetical protein
MDKLFDTKRKYIGYDGEEYIDMCIPVVKVKELFGNTVKKLNKDCNGRIDTFVWNSVAKNMDMIDMVMYGNHIFNPFSVKQGDLLNVPIDNDKLYKASDEPSLPDGTKHSKNTNGEKEQTYAEKIEDMGRKGLGVK